ncbi:Protein TOPLESS [Quillaja saponaria]|uniref:Protein TOPLESS n=1 Tax=Quillaja saponaria TaxID=32244 RepID=A0AAD7LJ22_QUISA|nr:Protein TOPLESS [Quillaja saponaria]
MEVGDLGTRNKGCLVMSTLSAELLFLILQFFDEEGYKETSHKLQCESGLYFDMKYFEEMVLEGRWDEAEKYLSGFTKVDDNKYSTKIYFEMRKQKFLEALDSKEHARALGILMKDLKVFSAGYEELFKEMTRLLTFNDIREHDLLSTYGNTESERSILITELKKFIEANPIFHGKLKFPSIRRQRLRRLLNQSLNWQHIHCADPRPDPDIKSLFEDHVCKPCSSLLFSQSTDNHSLVMSAPTSSTCRHSSPSTITDSERRHFGALTNPAVEVIGDPDNVSNRTTFKTSDEVTSTITHLDQSYRLGLTIANDLPKNVVQILNEISPPVSMDFHPIWHTILLVGTQIGHIGLWDVSSGGNLFSRNFQVLDFEACSEAFKAALVKDSLVSVNAILWSPDGSLFGAAFSKHIVQLYLCRGGNDISQQLEIEAHDGSVNDLAFSAPHHKLLVITCGDDKTVKVWDAITGNKCYTFEGHTAPVFSVCPHTKEHVNFIFSTSVDGKIKAWLYDTLGARVDYDAPGFGYTKMVYSAGTQRLFSCGTGKDGKSYLVEWDESEGYVKRTYKGLKKHCLSSLHFDTTKNRFLAAGDDHIVKFWDMDNVELWTTTKAGGDLPENPCIRFNKEGSLLAVSANENKIKILATNYGVCLQKSESRSVGAPRVVSGIGTEKKNGDMRDLEDVKFNHLGEANIKPKSWNFFEINRPFQCQSLQLPAHMKANKIVRLTYINAGNAILALASNAIHLLWKWPKYHNLSSQATTRVSPYLWQPRSNLQLMTNDLVGTKADESVSCFALSKNDSYLVSASGGMISLFNIFSFKSMMTIMPPPPVTTCLALHPQDNNIVAVGMDSSCIVIYNVRANKVESKLVGHSKRVTGLAFSDIMNVLVSADVGNQIIVWDANEWGKKREGYLQFHCEKMSEAPSDIHIQFHQDQIHFLTVLEKHLAIYEVTELRCIKQWFPGVSSVISHATFSCDGQMVYASFVDGTLAIFDALNLDLRCRISASAYLPLITSLNVYPLVIAAHPQKPTQFAVGLTDGRVYVLEPLETGGRWDMLPFVGEESAKERLIKDDLN